MKKTMLLLMGALICLVLTACATEDIDLCLHEWEEVVSEEYLISPATCVSPAKYYSVCKLCGETDVPFTDGELGEHEFVKNSEAEFCLKEATCTSLAEYVVSCKFCGVKGEQTYSDGQMLDHVKGKAMNVDTLVARPTCTTPPIYQYSCTVCHTLLDGTFQFGPKMPHPDVHGDFICDMCDKPLKVWEGDIPSDDMADIDRWD